MRNGIERKLGSLLVLLAVVVAMLATPAAAAAEPSVSAYSAIVIDYDTGEVLYGKDIDTMRVPASMTKVMTAYIIFEELEAGNLTWDTQLPISDAAAAMSRNSAYPTAVPLPYGDSLDVDTLLKLILIPSASASCLVAAEYISGSEAAFVERMNATAERLGLEAAYENCHGALPHYITARSQAMLIREFIQRFPTILDYTSMTSVYYNGTTWSNTNKLLTTYYYEGCDGFKTGTITAAGYCLSATAVRNGHRIISVVMHASNNDTRHRDSIALLDYGFAVLEEREQEQEQTATYPDTVGHWADPYIAQLRDLGANMCLEGAYFLPDDASTRAQYVTMLLTALEAQGTVRPNYNAETPFTDARWHWAVHYIAAAAELGLINGYGDGTFGPDDAITREQLLVIVDNCFVLPEADAASFTDMDSISDWALEAVNRGAGAGIIIGYEDGSFRPGDSVTKAETAVILCRLLESGYALKNAA